MRKTSKTSSDPTSLILNHLFNTREVRTLLSGITDSALNAWAGKHPLKKRIAGFLNRKLERPADTDSLHLSSLFDDPQVMQQLNILLPTFLQHGLETIDLYLQKIDELPPESQKQLVEALGKGIFSRGSLLTDTLRKTLVSVESQNPGLISNELVDIFENWYSTTDFGELKEALNLVQQGIPQVSDRLLEIIWEYPAKLVILLGFLPDLINPLVDVIVKSISRFNQAPPDLIADIVRSQVTRIEPARLANLVNELSELINKIQTGSALIGEPGSPSLEKLATDSLGKAFRNIDHKRFNKLKLTLIEARGSVSDLKTKMWAEDPALLYQAITQRSLLRQIKLERLNQKLAAIDELSQDDFDEMLRSLSSGIELQELSETVDLIIRLLERGQDSKAASGLLTKLISQIDPYQLKEGLAIFGDLAGDSLKELQRAVIPDLVISVCNALAPQQDEHEERAAEARQALSNLFRDMEVSS